MPAILSAGFALLALAAVPLLAFVAIGGDFIKPVAFACVQLASGAATLALLVGRGRLHATMSQRSEVLRPVALLLHTTLFATALPYVGPAIGAMVLLGSIHLSRLVVSAWRGPGRPALTWPGLAVIGGGLMGLIGSRPSPATILGIAAMSMAGVAWTIYTSLDRDTKDPLAANAGHHVQAVVITIPAALFFADLSALTPLGVALAVVSGAITSGLVYAVWGRVRQRLGVAEAVFAQLAVPTLTALGAVAMLDEPLSWPTAGAMIAVLGGTALSLAAKHGRGR